MASGRMMRSTEELMSRSCPEVVLEPAWAYPHQSCHAAYLLKSDRVLLVSMADKPFVVLNGSQSPHLDPCQPA